MSNVYYIILAGGSGTRLWPLSRDPFPKHLLKLHSKNSLIQDTISRILPLTSPNNIYVITGKKQFALIKKQLPRIPSHNIILEPAQRETGPCIALAASLINLLDPDATMVSLHSDHFIKNEKKFRQTIQAATTFAQQTNKLITIGIHPTHPATGYGYIESNHKIDTNTTFSLFSAKRFMEKPNQATAQAFISSGKYFWNSGIFVWKVAALFQEFKKLHPRVFHTIKRIQQALATKRNFHSLYEALPQKAIDYLILEKSTNVAVVPADFGWSDVGNYQTLKDILTNYPEENLVRGQHVTIGSQGCFIYCPNKLIATVGLKNMVIVDTDDVLLVCPQDRAQDIKKLVVQLKKDKRQQRFL